MSAVPSILAELATHTLWRRGELAELLLDETQLEIHKFVTKNQWLQTYILAARQLGKSFAMLVLAVELALKNPRKRINYLCKTLGSAKEITDASMQVIIEAAPHDCRPVYEAAKARWLFPNGASIKLFGADDDRSAARLRGGSVIATFIDESGFIDCLDNLLNNVLGPMGLRHKARTILLSTPATTPSHYSTEVIKACDENGALIKRTIWAPGLMTLEAKMAYLTQQATALNLTFDDFVLTTTFQREYLCEEVVEESLAIVPEFSKVKGDIVVEAKRPTFFDLYISIDPGMDDKTGVLFAIHDFKRAKTVIEHELLLSQANTSTIANEVRKVLREHYPATSLVQSHQHVWTFKSPDGQLEHYQAPYLAVVDDSSKRLSADLMADHQLNFIPALKDDSAAAINQMRLAVASKSVEINPRCVSLSRQLQYAVRTKPGGDMARTPKDGHFDLVAAMKYLIRAISPHHNPFPLDWGFTFENRAQKGRPVDVNPLSAAVLNGTHLGRIKLRRKQ